MNSLDSLFSPRSVAIVGASDNAARIGGRPLRYLLSSGFEGAIYPINPNRDQVQGVRAFRAVADLPQAPEVALLALPASQTLEAVEQCAAAGVKAGIIFSAGFAELGDEGAALQARMTAVAREGGMRLLGPNCLGAADAGTGYYGTFSVMLDTAFLTPGPVAVVSQSGAYGAHIAHLARARGLGIRHWISTGNEADVDVAESLRWLVDKDDVRVVMAYAEGVRNAEVFVEALDLARRRGKAVVFMKVGRSDVGAKAATSHTAALTGSDAVFDGIFRQFGVHRARTTAEQIDIAYACAGGRYPKNRRLGVFTMSGGFGIQMADDAQDCGLEVAPMPPAAQEELKALLPSASPVNPVDATAQAVTDLPILTRFVDTMLSRGDYGLFAGILGSLPGQGSFSKGVEEALLEAVAGHEGVISALTMSAPADVVRSYEDKGFLVFEDSAQLTGALSALARFGESFKGAAARPVPAAEAAADLPHGPLSEHAAKQLLAQAGVAFPGDRLATAGMDVGAVAGEVGFPVVLKICSPDIPHKTEVGGVVLNVRDEAEARRGAETLLRRAAAAAPGAAIEGILVCPMVSGGVETIVGVSNDPVFGPVVLFGLGGVLVEVLKDVTFRLAPFGVDEARRMIGEIRGYKVLEGVRGAPPADVEALAELLSRLSVFAAANAARIASIDLNPVLVMPAGQGVRPLDALVELSASEAAAGQGRSH